MKTSYLFKHSNYLTRTAIEREQKQFIKIAFAVHLSAAISAERYRSDSGALKSAVFNFVFFIMLKNKIEQSAKTNSLLDSPTDRTFENRRSRYKEPSKNKAEAYRVYVEHLFLRSDAGDARIFSKEETGLYYYGARYLDPKYSRWLSGDPALGEYIPKAPIDDEAKKYNENLPGMGGIYNTVNLHVYHYAGNNPIKYVDPDGKFTFQLGTGRTLAGGTAATAEVGICFSYDKDKGVDFGVYSKEGIGSFIGYAITWNLSITITPMSKEITDISGTALSVGGSGGNAKMQPFSIGGEYSIPLDKSMLANQSGTISVSVGYSSIAEGHSIVNTTQVKSLKGWFKNMANDVKIAVVFFERKVSEFISETIDKFKFSQE